MLNARGVPKSGLLSISAGGMRKQVQLSGLDRPLRFPAKSADDISQIKVDVLDVLGRARLPYQPCEQKYTVPLESNAETSATMPNMEVDIIVRPCDPESPSGLSKEQEAEARRRKEVDANGYLEEHGLVNFMQFLLHSLMQDKPTNPYPFLQKQVAMRMQAAGGASLSYPISPSSGAIPTLSTPLLTVPALQDPDIMVDSLLERTSPQAAQSFTPEEIANLEREAEETRKRLLEDNAQLRETAMQMNLEYERLMKESAALHDKLGAKRASKNATRTQEAYREIEKLQEEVSQLARENAKLVADLARGREMIDQVRQDMIKIRQTVEE